MSEVTGLLHGPELPPAGVPTRVQFRGDYLRVTRVDGSVEDVAGDAIDVSVTGFNEDTLQLSWQRNGQTHAVTIGDAAAARALVESAPPGFAPRLARGHSTMHYHYRWYVSDDDEVNAYALPGGIVVVNQGMIQEAASAEELAGVLAHEVQHVEHRHTLQQLISSAGWAAVLAVVLGDVSAVTAMVIHQLGNLRNSRKLEAQADTEGMKALADAGIPLGGMASLFRRLQAEEAKKGGDGPALLSSHPATDERIAALDQLAGMLKCNCRKLDIDWPAVQAAAGVVP